MPRATDCVDGEEPPADRIAATTRESAENRRGILYIVAGMACLVVNDSAVKYVGQSMSVAQLICVRGVMAVAMLFGVAHALGIIGRLPTLLNRAVGRRLVFDCTTTLLFIFSLMHLPIGNATAINLASPLMMALLAVMFLGERPGVRRWIAIAIGFAGIVMVIQPRVDGFNAWSLMCLGATVSQSVRDLLTRSIPPAIPSILIALASLTFITSIAAVGVLIEGWQPIATFELGLLAIAAALLAAGYFFMIASMRHGEMSVVAPFRYSGLLVALVTGFVVWGDVPNGLAWGGIALLIGAGVYLLHEERRRRSDELPTA